MSALLISDNIGNILMEALHNFKSLGVIAYAEEFLDHVVGVLMSYEIGEFQV
jgi:hypothetical protein